MRWVGAGVFANKNSKHGWFVGEGGAAVANRGSQLVHSWGGTIESSMHACKDGRLREGQERTARRGGWLELWSAEVMTGWQSGQTQEA